ncbi:MAG: hypothetical protein Phog2KO_00710 [Phototrophicaceae bacterium]
MRYWIIVVMVLLSACGSADNAEEIIDFEADIQAYSTEAANLRNDMVISSTTIAQTVTASEAQVNTYTRYNSLLLSTTVAIFPPADEERILANDIDGPLPAEVYDLSTGEMRFVQIGPAGDVDENGCFRAKQQFFRPSNGAVYMTAVALNLRAGTTVRADWQYGSDLVHSSSWVAPQSEQYRCISLAMSRSDVEFGLGNWSVTLSINGEPTDPRSFTILSD